MVTPQFIAAGKKNLEKCPTRHGEKVKGAGRPKSQLKEFMTETGASKEDIRKACEFVLFNFTYKGLEDFVKNERDKAPAIILALAEMLINDGKKGRLKNVDQMLNIIYGKGQLTQYQQED
jgi:hypothetical protein